VGSLDSTHEPRPRFPVVNHILSAGGDALSQVYMSLTEDTSDNILGTYKIVIPKCDMELSFLQTQINK
jgi:hypothetical protein